MVRSLFFLDKIVYQTKQRKFIENYSKQFPNLSQNLKETFNYSIIINMSTFIRQNYIKFVDYNLTNLELYIIFITCIFTEK